jgi:hypothetical protein
MNRALLRLLLFLTLVGPVAAQPPAQTPAWDVTLKTNTVANSNLEVVNRCKKNHQFQIQTTNLPFLHFSSTQLSVKGGGKELVPVKFDTSNLAPGVYQGSVLVICQSCKGEATCTQDREVLQVVLRVTGELTTTGPPPSAQISPTQPTSPGATNQPTPQTTSPGQTIASPTPETGPTSVPTPVGLSAADLKKRCEDLQRQLNEAKGPCERKERECAELERKLAAAEAAAQKTQQDYDQKKNEFNDAMQNLLNSIAAAGKEKGYQVKLSLTKQGDRWVPLKLADGVVIYFDASDIDQQIHIDNLASALRALVSSSVVRQLKQQAAGLAEAEAKNKAAQAALAAARQSYEKCKEERDALCPKVKELQAELDKCEKEAVAQAEAERKLKEKQEADRKAAEETRRLADEAEKKRQAAEKRAKTDAENAAKAAAEADRKQQERESKRRDLCSRCSEYLRVPAAVDLPQRVRQVVQALLQAMTSPSAQNMNALKAQLVKLSEAMSKENELKDSATKLKGLADQIDPAGDVKKFAELMDGVGKTLTVAGVSVWNSPLRLGGFFFQSFADVLSAIASLPDAIGRVAKQSWLPSLDKWNCDAYASFLQTNQGDIEGVMESIFGKDEVNIMKTRGIKDTFRRAVEAKLRMCCAKWILESCEDPK